MTILAPGTFKTSDYRKAIPAAVEREVRKRYELDHDPALTNRAYDTDAGDFIPPQHDASKIFLREKPAHDEKTLGRKAGAAKTVTTRSSDVGERARTRKIRRTQSEHQTKMLSKRGIAGDEPLTIAFIERDLRIGLPLKRAKRKIPSRPFTKGHRPMRSRNDLKRRKS
jgi:hypothetical protein